MEFALYVCLIDLRKRYADDDIEIVIDRISTPYKRIQLAKQYARTDTFEDLKVENIQMFPLEKTDSFKRFFPWSVPLLKMVMCGTCSTSELPIQFGIKLGGVTELSSSGMIARLMTFSPRYLRPFDINAPRRAGRQMDRSL